MIDLNFTSFPILHTEQLVLRQLNNEDDAAIFSLRSNDIVNKYIDRPKATTIEDAKIFISYIIKNKSLYWAIALKENNELIGTICLWNFNKAAETADLGYELIPTFQGKGFMDEALKAIIHFSFNTLQLKTIDAFVHQENTNSIKLLQKNNFILNENKNNPENKNEIVYSLIEPI